MSNNAGYVVNISGITPSASDEHANRALKEQNQEVDQQTCTLENQGTDLQDQPDPSENEHAAPHLDGTESRVNGTIAHDNTPTTRNTTNNHDHEALGGHFDTVSSDWAHEDATQTMMQTLNNKACALVGGSTVQPTSQVKEPHDHIETTPYINNNNNASPAMLATLVDQAYALVGAPNGLTTAQIHRNLNHPKTPPDTHIHGNNNHTMVATLQDQAYTLIEGPVEVLRTNLNADSHDLAHELPEVRGAIQTECPSRSNAEVARDVGWHKANAEIPDPLIGGYTNGELFAFIRRFNKVELSRS
jgi:hypothetical protein